MPSIYISKHAINICYKHTEGWQASSTRRLLAPVEVTLPKGQPDIQGNAQDLFIWRIISSRWVWFLLCLILYFSLPLWQQFLHVA